MVREARIKTNHGRGGLSHVDKMSLFLKRMGREETFHIPPDKDKIVIGRSPVCDINFPSVYISRQHCQILRISSSGALILKNIKNTNCTYINELKLQNTDAFAELQVGCRIGLGVPLEYATGTGMQNKDFVFLKLESSQPANENNERTENQRNAQIALVSDASHPCHPQETTTHVQGASVASHPGHPQETATPVQGASVATHPGHPQETATPVQGASVATHPGHPHVQDASVATHPDRPQKIATYVQGASVATYPGHIQETTTHVQDAAIATCPGYPQETATNVQGASGSCLIPRPDNQASMVYLPNLKLRLLSLKDGLNSGGLSTQEVSSTSQGGPPISIQGEISQMPTTTSNSLHVKDRVSQKEGGSEGELKKTQQLKNNVENFHSFEFEPRKFEHPVGPVQEVSSNHKFRQGLSEEDLSCVREANENKVGMASVSENLVTENEESHSPISIDLTQANPDSPMGIDVHIDTPKESFICLLSSDEDSSNDSSFKRNSLQREHKEISGKRKRLTYDELYRGARVTEDGEGSSSKKKIRSSLHSDIDSDSKNEPLVWNDSNSEMLASNRRTDKNSSKIDLNKAAKDSASDNEPLGHETKSNKNSNDVLELSESDNELFVQRRKIKKNAKKSNADRGKQDSDRGPLMLSRKIKQNLKKCVSNKSLQNSSSDEEPLTLKRKNYKKWRIIDSSTGDSDFEDVPSEKDIDKRDLSLMQHVKKCSVHLTRVSCDTNSSLVTSRAHFSLKGASSSSSKNKDSVSGDGKKHSSKTHTNDKDCYKPQKKRKNSVKEAKDQRDGVQNKSVSLCELQTSAITSLSCNSADLKGRNMLMERDKFSSICNSEEDRISIKQEPVANKVEISTEIKIKTEPSTSCTKKNNSGKDALKKDDDFMYSQVGDEIWLSSDEEDTSSPSGPTPTSPDADLIFLGEDEQPSHMEVINSHVKEELVEGDSNDDVDEDDQWFPVLSQSFLQSSDEEEEEEKDEDGNKDFKDFAENAVGSEPKPGPSGVSECLPDNECKDDEWWPVLSQGFFDEFEQEEDQEKEKADSSKNTELETRDEPTGGTSDLQSVIEKLRKAAPRTSQLTEAKIPMQHRGKKSRRGSNNSTEIDSYPKTEEPPTTVKKLTDDSKKINPKQGNVKSAGLVNKVNKQNKNSKLRKDLTSKYNLVAYKTTLECRTKEKHHLIDKNNEKSKKPPPDPVVIKRTVDPKSSKNISIQKKAKSVDAATQDQARPKVAAKVTKKTRFEKLIDVDLFSRPSKRTTVSKKKHFRIPKSSNDGASCSSKSSEATGSELVLRRQKDVGAVDNYGRSESPSNNAHNEIQNLPTSVAPTCNGPADKIEEISTGIRKVRLKPSKPKKVHFPEKEEDLVKVLLISPRKIEKTGLPSVRASEMLPEELKLQRQNIPPYYMELFIHQVCRWNYDWLESYHLAQEKYKAGVLKGTPALPPIVASTNYPILILYNSYNDYRETHSNLFYLELWERIYSDWVRYRSRSSSFQSLIEYMKPAFIRTRTGVLKFWTLKVMVAIPLKQGVNNHNFRQGTLISLKIRKETKRSVIFGYVDYIMANNKNMAQNQALAQMAPNLTLGVRVVKEMIETVKPGTVISITDVSYIRPCCRIWESLHKLPLSPLCKDILSPTPSAFSCEKKMEYLIKDLPLNEAQRKAVTEVSSKCMFDSHIPKLSLIHGPPGTGKTSTIVALIAQMAMIGSNIFPVNMPRCKVLICAPSNAAVDELTLRLIHLRDIGLSLRVVRVGFKASDHPVVRNYTLDQFVNKKVQMELSTPRCESARQELQRRKILVQQVAEDLENARKERRQNEIRQLEVRLNEMARAKADLERSFVNEPSGHEKYQLHHKWQQEFLLNAEIITTTLSSCVSGIILEVLAKHPNHFTCCIVDEAGQCQETETLLPLLLGIRKLVLVGDHYQLPATVLSQLAQSKNLKQSLFERLHHRLVLELQRDDVVHTLNVQYRMHPQIVEWPAHHFYHEKLVSEVRARPSTNLNPYVIFDLKTSQEQRHQNMEIYNPAEASLVYTLLEVMLPHLSGKTVGIITPYQCQRFYLEEKLARLKNKINLCINTIDGFQGQERDVIVLSFVRANNSASIGFLAQRQRLNVALTRAKEVCYIVASLSSLEGNREWNSLIRNGKQRRNICTVTTKEENDKKFIKSVIENKETILRK